MHPDQVQAVVAELAPVVGGKIQRVDVVAERELVLEIRCPGRTVRLLLSARPGLGRVHVVEARPARVVPGGGLQALLRSRLVGRPLVALEAEGRCVRLDALTHVLEVQLDGKKDAIRIRPPSGRAAPEPRGEAQLPEVFAASAAVEALHRERLPAENDRVLRDQLLKQLGARSKKLTRLVAHLESDAAKLTAFAADAHRGELLKTQLGRVSRGASSFSVVDWMTGEAVEVPLDPALGPKENLERFFQRAKRASRGLPMVRARLEQVRARLAVLDEERRSIQTADSEALLRIAEGVGGGALEGVDLARVERGATPESGPLRKDAKPRPLDQWSRRFVALDGTEILVGKGARENDRLTFNGARADDLWLHARGTSGAHVILRNEKGRTPHPEAMLDAAHLAAYHSGARREAKAEIVWTEARHVKKTKGDPPGRVGVAKGRTLLVQLDERRLARLLGKPGVHGEG
jgi:predicted ribosome quality control (RQC) complex YloA/Tae2 family protein